MANELVRIEPAGQLVTVPRLSQSPAAVYLSRLAPGSRRVVSERLRAIAGLVGITDINAFPWWELKYQHTIAIRAQIVERYSPATARAMLSALRAVLKEAWRLGLMDIEQMTRACDLQPVRGKTLQKGRALGSDELSRLFANCGSDRTGVRNAALLAVLYGAGLRRAEAAGLDVADYDSRDATIAVRHGKGNKGRSVPLPDFAVERLGAWIEQRGDSAGPLFVRIRRGDHLTQDRLTPQAVAHILSEIQKRAGVAEFTPHDMRRTTITHLLDSGIDINTVRDIAGHSSVNTTSRYDKRGEHVKRAAVQKLRID